MIQNENLRSHGSIDFYFKKSFLQTFWFQEESLQSRLVYWLMYLITFFYEGLSWQYENYQFIKQYYHYYWSRVNSEECSRMKFQYSLQSWKLDWRCLWSYISIYVLKDDLNDFLSSWQLYPLYIIAKKITILEGYVFFKMLSLKLVKL